MHNYLKDRTPEWKEVENLGIEKGSNHQKQEINWPLGCISSKLQSSLILLSIEHKQQRQMAQQTTDQMKNISNRPSLLETSTKSATRTEYRNSKSGSISHKNPIDEEAEFAT